MIHRNSCNKNPRESESQNIYCQLKKIWHLKLMNLSFFYIWDDASIWPHWNIPVIYTLMIWGQYPAFFHHEFPLVHGLGQLQELKAWKADVLLLTDMAGKILHPHLFTSIVMSNAEYIHKFKNCYCGLNTVCLTTFQLNEWIVLCIKEKKIAKEAII